MTDLFSNLTARLTLALLVVTLALVIPATGIAKNGKKHKAPTANNPSFVCDGTSCTFTVTGLAPSTGFQSSISFSSTTGAGCNTGTSGWRTDANGVYTQVLDESEIKCSLVGSGTVHAWLRSADSGSFSDPPVHLLNGDPAEIVTPIS